MTPRRLGAAIVLGTALVGALAHAAQSKVVLEIWGLEAGDALSLDGAALNVRSGGAARVFVGDPEATNAPVLHEVATGKREIVVQRAGCAPRAFAVSIESPSKRAIVLEREDPERCALPFAPARREEPR